MSTAPLRAALPPWYTWGVPGSRLQVRIRLLVVEGLQQQLARAGDSADATPIGGILTGYFIRPGITEIAGFQPLSTLDRASMEAAVADVRSPAAGYYCIKRDGDLRLNEEDLKLADHFLKHPNCVILVIDGGPRPARATFLYREGGRMQTDSPPLEFPLDASLLGVTERYEENVRESQIGRLQGHGDAPHARTPSIGRYALWVMFTASLLFAGFAVFLHFKQSPKGKEPVQLVRGAPTVQSVRTGFAANPEGTMWRLTWNRDAVAALRPSGAVLSIQDGANEQRVSLTEADLSSGTFFYTPETGSLLFSFILLTPGSLPVAEQVRVLEAIRDTTKPAEPSVQIQLNDHKVRTLRPFYDAGRPQGLPSERKTAALDAAPPPALPASGGTALSAPIPLLPMQVPAAPQSAREAAPAVPVPQTPGPTPTAAPLLQTAAAAPVAPPASAVRTPEPVVAKPSYVGPKAIRQMPASPLPASMPAGGSVSVQLRVEIAANGKVSKVTPTERHAANFKLVDAAIRAAQFWVFEPAQENGHPVPSEMLLNFHFGAQ